MCGVRGLFGNFEFSRHQRLPDIPATTDASVQRSGTAFPRLLPHGSTPKEALSLTAGTSPLGKALNVDSPPEVRRRVQSSGDNPKSKKLQRRRVVENLRTLSDRLRPFRTRLSALLPTGSLPAR